jgi:hypothetical protein
VLSNNSEQTERTESEIGVLAPVSQPARAAARLQSPPAGRAEAQLRARVADLEAQLIEVARCLNDAEVRAASLQAEVERAWGSVAVMANSKSWRYTTALRSVVARVRRLF